MVLQYNISDVRPYISWIYFYHAWSMNGKYGEERDRLTADANAMLDEWEGHYHTHAVFELFDANSDGDDIVVPGGRLPMLRQQLVGHATRQGKPNLCLADFIRPQSMGVKDKIGVFTTTVDAAMEKSHVDDVYRNMLALVLSERLAEATAERMHEEVRRHYWGYAKDEQVTIDDELNAHYQGIRPAVGYPSMPDMSMNFVLDHLIGFGRIGIRLTETGMMYPKASVSGLMFAHPKATYFSIGKIGMDQLTDYARRRELPVEVVRPFLQSSLAQQ